MEQGRWLKWTGLGPQEQVGLDLVMAPSYWDKPIAIFIKDPVGLLIFSSLLVFFP